MLSSKPSKLPRILRNAARCKKCSSIIESRHVHDFVWCACKAVFTDGGTEYVRRGGDLDSLEDLTEYEEVKHVED